MSFSFGVVTLFPEMFSALTDYGVVGRAFKAGKCLADIVNPRDYTEDAHRTVDDLPYGGGPGMVMKPEPLYKAVLALKSKAVYAEAPVVYLSPQGKPIEQVLINEWAARPSVIFIAGRYEGVDERIIEAVVDLEVSVGDIVVSGGELPAMMLMDAIARQREGVLGDQRSAAQDSFCSDRLDWPHYTRPEDFEGLSVPFVLRSGNHKAIAQWRLQQACARTLSRRPDMLTRSPLSEEEKRLLREMAQTEK